MADNLTDKIRRLLESKGLAYKEINHGPTITCEESAAARGEPQEIGGKTLLFKS